VEILVESVLTGRTVVNVGEDELVWKGNFGNRCRGAGTTVVAECEGASWFGSFTSCTSVICAHVECWWTNRL
jgi:hypothetical protein